MVAFVTVQLTSVLTLPCLARIPSISAQLYTFEAENR